LEINFRSINKLLHILALLVTIDAILQPYQRFGVHLGLDRIQQLLTQLGNPQQQIPVVHVGGTNGKGSVCAYLSSVLTAAGYKVGRYTSPHLIDWTERICVNGAPISEGDLIQVLEAVQRAIDPKIESPTQFEVFTAAAWLYFAQSKVDIAIIEVGLGGRLDATNVCDRVLLSIITSLSREHWQTLGSTLTEIATEKAGILKPSGEAIIGKLPPEAEQVFRSVSGGLNCQTFWVEPSLALANNRALFQPPTDDFSALDYPLALLGKMQLMNSAIAIAALQRLQQKGWHISAAAIEIGMKQTQWLGRVQWITWRNRPLLIDGAHNSAAAIELRRYVDTLQKPVSWVMGMLSTKDHLEIFKALLSPGDRLYLAPVPDHSTADPQALGRLAQQVCPALEKIAIAPELFVALNWAQEEETTGDRPLILCGSLYLVGYFLAKNTG